jgi:hypothetical protein
MELSHVEKLRYLLTELDNVYFDKSCEEHGH